MLRVAFYSLTMLALGSCVSREPDPATYCKASSDCPSTKPICDPVWNSCFACTKGSDCSSGICNTNGSCLAETEITYVDNKNGSCSSGNGSKATPFCDLQSAIATGTKETIKVAESTASYGKLSVTSGKWQVLGPDTSYVKLSGDLTNPAVNISGSNTEISFSGIEITGGGTGQDGITCGTQPSSLTLTRSIIRNVSGAGISATKCTVIVDRAQIGPGNSGGGIKLTDSKYSITNSLIVDNSSGTAPAVSFGSNTLPIAGPSGFLHNTLVNNTFGATKAGAIACNSSDTIRIENSIIWDNGKSNGGMPSQVSGDCALQNTLINDPMIPTGTGNKVSPAPDFKSAADYHLSGKTTSNLACCIDQIDTSAIDHDFDGTKRPQGPKFDIGAHEVR